MAGHLLKCFVLLLLVLPACAGTEAPPDEMLPPPPSRQSELVRIYDTMCGDDDSAANAAAKQAAAGDDKDHRFLASLWGSRPRSALGARRFGTALAANSQHQKSFDWFERAFLFVGADDPLLPWLRYEMAQEYVALGRHQDAINLLANRMGTAPLPPELKVKYDELIRKAS
jgi:tetratricopeptide (TPR) repeat protein